MTRDAALERARKLLRLAKSDNANEAALAAARAQEILDRYKLSADALTLDGQPEPEEPIRGFQAPLDGEPDRRLPTWMGRLAAVVARANQCFVYYDDGQLKIVGGGSDADAVRYLYAFLKAETERLAARDAKGNGRTWANNYRLGCIQTIQERLREQRKATIAEVKQETSAIVRIDQALARLESRTKAVEAYATKAFGLVSRGVARAGYDNGAREAGRRAAREIQLGGGRGLRAGHRELGS